MGLETFGKCVENARIIKGMSQRALALKAKTTNSTVSRIESDSVRPDPDTVFKISSALDLDYNSMMVLCGYIAAENREIKKDPSISKGYSEQSVTLMDIVEQLTPDQQQLVLERARVLDELNRKQPE